MRVRRCDRRTRWGRRSHQERQDGRILILGLGLGIVGLMLVAAVTSIADVRLDGRRLTSIAESVALDAATATHPIRGLTLNDEDVARAASLALTSLPSGARPSEIRIESNMSRTICSA
jgi:hypothetical protein